MKAWNDIESLGKILYETSTSRYWVDHGVKIERFQDGRVEVYNLMSRGDSLSKVTPVQWDMFNEHGWVAGICEVNIHECERRLGVIRERVVRLGVACDEDIDELIIKMEKYKLMKI